MFSEFDFKTDPRNMNSSLERMLVENDVAVLREDLKTRVGETKIPGNGIPTLSTSYKSAIRAVFLIPFQKGF